VNVDELHHPEKYAVAKEEFRETIPKSGDFKGDIKVSFLILTFISFF
jgi:hypothetical protein